MVSLARARLGATQGKLKVVESALSSLSGMLDRVLGIAMAVAAVLVVVWPFAFTASIGLRTFFHVSTSYLEEYTGYWTLVITCLALAYTFRREGHIRVSVVVEYLSQKARDILEIFVAFVALIAAGAFTAYSTDLLIFAIERDIRCIYGSSTLLWPVYLWLSVGYGLLSLALFLYFCRAILVVLGKDYR